MNTEEPKPALQAVGYSNDVDALSLALDALNTAADKDRQIAVLTKALEHYADEKRWNMPKKSLAMVIFTQCGGLGFSIAAEALAEAKRIQEGKWMKVERMKWITREVVRANPDKVFLFGDNVERRGMGGQAKEMRYEPNAVGIRVKHKPSQSRFAYFTDAYVEGTCRVILEDIHKAIEMASQLSGIIVIPADGIGTGLAELDKRAPKTFAYLQQKLAELEKI